MGARVRVWWCSDTPACASQSEGAVDAGGSDGGGGGGKAAAAAPDGCERMVALVKGGSER